MATAMGATRMGVEGGGGRMGSGVLNCLQTYFRSQIQLHCTHSHLTQLMDDIYYK